jgi:hypothetical protein
MFRLQQKFKNRHIFVYILPPLPTFNPTASHFIHHKAARFFKIVFSSLLPPTIITKQKKKEINKCCHTLHTHAPYFPRFTPSLTPCLIQPTSPVSHNMSSIHFTSPYQQVEAPNISNKPGRGLPAIRTVLHRIHATRRPLFIFRGDSRRCLLQTDFR